MQINLKLRAVTAYCSPCKAILADNEDITINVLDRGQLKERVVLLCNGKTYVADENKIITLPRGELGGVNVLELTEREADTDKVIKRFVVENLYVIPRAAGDNGSRLLAERKFYEETFAELLNQVNALSTRQAELEKRQADLENGKYTMFKFRGKEQ